VFGPGLYDSTLEQVFGVWRASPLREITFRTGVLESHVSFPVDLLNKSKAMESPLHSKNVEVEVFSVRNAYHAVSV